MTTLKRQLGLAAVMAVVMGDRMVVAGLAVDRRTATARAIVKTVAFLAVVGAIGWALATWMRRGS